MTKIIVKSQSLPSPERRVILGVVGAPHGIRGECRVKSFTEDPLSFAEYGSLFVEDGRVFVVNSCRFLKDDMLVVKFNAVDDRDLVQTLKGLELFIDRALFPEIEEEEEFYHADLLGLEIFDLDGNKIGKLKAIHNFGAGDMLEIWPLKVEKAGDTWLQPFTKIATPELDLKAGKIVIDASFIAKPSS